jgi:hypothetical protein
MHAASFTSKVIRLPKDFACVLQFREVVSSCVHLNTSEAPLLADTEARVATSLQQSLKRHHPTLSTDFFPCSLVRLCGLALVSASRSHRARLLELQHNRRRCAACASPRRCRRHRRRLLHLRCHGAAGGRHRGRARPRGLAGRRGRLGRGDTQRHALHVRYATTRRRHTMSSYRTVAPGARGEDWINETAGKEGGFDKRDRG